MLTDISAIRDESDENTRVVIELETRRESKDRYQQSLQTHGDGKLLRGDHASRSITDGPNCFRSKKQTPATSSTAARSRLRRTRFELRKAEERAETLEGYLIALANLDEFIRIIRGSANRDEARVKLLAFEFTRKQVEQIGILIRNETRLVEGRYAFSEHQTNQILDLRLYQLTGLERDKIDQSIQGSN